VRERFVLESTDGPLEHARTSCARGHHFVLGLEALTRPPSQQLTEQAAFTPYPFEDVGAMIRDSNPDLYLFSSDYPHIEGGRNPIGRFENALGDRSEAIRDKFYAENFLRIFPDARAH